MPRKATAPVLTLVQHATPAPHYRPQTTSDTYLLKALGYGDPVTAAQYERVRQAALDKGIVLSVRPTP